MNSTSGGPPPPPESIVPTTTPLSARKEGRYMKRPKIDSPGSVEDVTITLSPMQEEILEKQKKLKTTIELMLDEIQFLNSTLGDKTKKETRLASEKLQMMKETIILNEALTSLGDVVTIHKPETKDDSDVSMEEAATENETICSKCKKEIADEDNLRQEVKKIIEELHVTEPETLGIKAENILKKNWPEDCFQRSEIVVGNPLAIEEGDIALILKDIQDESMIVKRFQEKFPGLKNIIEEDLLNSNLEYLESSTRTKNGAETSKRFYVSAGASIDEIFLSLKELEKETRLNGSKLINMVAADLKTRQLARKLMEIVFLQNDVKIKVFTPKKESHTQPRENKYETIVVTSANKSYSDMLRAFRENINPEEIGIDIRTTRKTKDDSLLIVAEKGKRDLLQRKINENESLKEIQIVQKKCELILSGMDAITTEAEIKSAIIQKLGNEQNVEVKSMYTNRNCEQIATLVMPAETASMLLHHSPIKIGWSMCRLKEKVIVPRCTNCLKMGHTMRYCRDKNRHERRCLKCTKEGHVSKDCENQSYCLSCAAVGHRSDSMSCPKYRRMVNQRGSTL